MTGLWNTNRVSGWITGAHEINYKCRGTTYVHISDRPISNASIFSKSGRNETIYLFTNHWSSMHRVHRVNSTRFFLVTVRSNEFLFATDDTLSQDFRREDIWFFLRLFPCKFSSFNYFTRVTVSSGVKQIFIRPPFGEEFQSCELAAIGKTRGFETI